MKEKRKFKFPGSIEILFIIICVVTLATYLIPAGSFDMNVNPESGMEQVVPGSFHNVEQNPVTPFRMFVGIQEGFIDGAMIIFLILFGYFWVYSILQTGAFTAMINKLLKGKARDSKLFIPLVMLVFALAGSTYGEMETVYGLIPIFVALSIAMGYDAVVGLCISSLACMVGFASATTNPFTIGIAQSFGELPIFSGLGLRWCIFVVFYIVTVLWVLRYASKIKKNPEKSVVAGLDYSSFKLDLDSEDAQKFTGTHMILMLGMILTIVLIVFGSLKLGWYINEMSAVFIISGIISSLIARKGPAEIAKNLVTCCADMIPAILVVGLSRSILVILSNGMIIHSVINGMATLMNGLPSWATAEMMLVTQNIVNFFIPSGSGQAAAMMPIMIPLADLADVNRQVAVLAYQFGDGFSNALWPAGCAVICGIAKVPLDRWYRFFLPLFGIMFLLQSAFIIFADFINYGPF